MTNDDPDPNGKLLWDVVALRLGAQSANQTAIVGRAKDLMGLTTIVATITGVILNDKLFTVVKGKVDTWWLVLAAVALLVVFGAGLWALRPGDWSFAPDALSFYAIEKTYPSASAGQFYRSLAMGYLLPGTDGKPRIVRNQDRLKFLSNLVIAEGWGLIALGILAFILPLVIDTAAVVTPSA